jgi:hypothetical protein
MPDIDNQFTNRPIINRQQSPIVRSAICNASSRQANLTASLKLRRTTAALAEVVAPRTPRLTLGVPRV